MRIAIWWVRRDLRLTDNRALTASLAAADQVVPLFILDDYLLSSRYNGEQRTAFLMGGLAALDADLRTRASYLVVRHGEAQAILAALSQELYAHNAATQVQIFAEADTSPYAKQRDTPLRGSLPITFVDGLSILPLERVRKADGSPYTVFTPYSRRWKEAVEEANGYLHPSSPELSPPERVPTPAGISTVGLPDSQQSPAIAGSFPPGEAEAIRRLTAFSNGTDAPIFRYAVERDRPDLNGTSQLSPYLRFGMLSARHAAAQARRAIHMATDLEARHGAHIWLDELIWRDFYLMILDRFPHVRRGSFRPDYDRIRWRNDESEFAAWCGGQTGYPFIDAAMRQLLAIGWMHNRARMAVASFLVKDLLIDWRWGETWFMQHLIDGDPAANNGGWQWAAGTGTDAAPYFRIFNPVNQGTKFDPDGVYVRHWVPELSEVPNKFIHEPWRLSGSDQTRARCRIGTDYPAPIVDHKDARTRTLAAYKDAIQ